ELSNWGEIFLNPELKKILQYAYFKKINLTSYTGVNLNNVSEDILECLVKYKLRYLNISLDGATNKTYKIYRQGGDFNKVIRNIKLINYFKKKYSSKFPQLSWQFILMGHNIHELLAARKMANTLGMHFFFKLNNNPSYSPIVDKKLVRKISKLSVMSRKEFFQKYKRLYIPFCKQFWTSPQINWDGKLLGCCKNIYDDFGNVFDTSLKHCLNNERYIYVKQMILGKKEGRSDIPCSKCHIYPLIKRKSLKKREILRNFNII
ncbi:MAG: radical SAM/SPASM domain-containing protein, partial [Promethearchaeota archaeon]